MTHSATAAAQKAKAQLGFAGLAVLVLVPFQVALSTICSEAAWDALRRGDIHALVFLAISLSTALLALGAALLIFRPRAAVVTFFMAAILYGLARIYWFPFALVTGFVLAVCAGLVSARRAKLVAKV